MPNVRFVKLKYIDWQRYTHTANVFDLFAMYQSSANHPLERDIVTLNVGHQPMYFDQLSALYKYYRVFGIKYKFTFQATTTDESFRVVVKHQDTNIAEVNNYTGYYGAVERGNCKTGDGGTRNGSHDRVTIKGYLSVAKTLGVARSAITYEDNFQGNMNNSVTQFSGTNPPRMAFLALYVHCTNAVGFDVKTELEYFTRISDTTPIPIS